MRLAITGPDERFPSFSVVERPFAVVGRAAECDVVLKSPEVSYRHAYIQQVAGRLCCIDLGSRTGTHWPDAQRNWGWLSADEFIRVGPYSIRSADPTPAFDATTPGDPGL